MNSTKHLLGSHPLKPDLQQRLDDFLQLLKQEADHFLGYPCSREFDYTSLYPFLDFPLNNVGDPFVNSRFQLNSHDYECEVIRFFTELTHGEQDQTWGYVESAQKL